MHTNNGTKVNTHVIWTYNKTKISYIATYIKKQLASIFDMFLEGEGNF